MIGYHTSYDHNLVGMAMTQGRREDVVNIGIGIKEIGMPPGMTANDFAISLYHRVCLTLSDRERFHRGSPLSRSAHTRVLPSLPFFRESSLRPIVLSAFAIAHNLSAIF